MLLGRYVYVLLAATLVLAGCRKERVSSLRLEQVLVGTEQLSLADGTNEQMPIDRSITLAFSQPVNQSTAAGAISLVTESGAVAMDIGFANQGRSVVIYPVGVLSNKTVYTIQVSTALKSEEGAGIDAQRVSFTTVAGDLSVESIEVGGTDVGNAVRITNVPPDLGITIRFSVALNEATVQDAVHVEGIPGGALQVAVSADRQSLSLTVAQLLDDLTRYELTISDALKGDDGQGFSGLTRTLYTAIDLEPKFPVISDDELLTKVQQQTFSYFWDFAHPTSGMVRERNTSGNLVTSGGSGFGVMALVVGMERGFITRDEGLARLATIVAFLENADRFHGAWSHWINGNTGAAMPFSANDNGGDLVETSLLMQGLITIRQYLAPGTATEKQLIDRINALWRSVEWDWYQRNGQGVLYWHWSPDKGWAMNLPIRGWNESLITYVLAAASPTHGIDEQVYHNGWAREGAMENGRTYENTLLPLGPPSGGPLFFSQYSFLGIDPRGLSDRYADYWTQNVNHTLINYRYCVRNPKQYVGYGSPDGAWGLTASDSHNGYAAHSPTNDLGVITPSAALSAFPYTPEESMAALKFFYYTLGDRLWGPHGFYDAFNLTEQWVADSYLAIDQGPIIAMIENYRTGLLWDLFMSAPEVKAGLRKLGFDSPKL